MTVNLNFGSQKFERIKDMPKLKQEIISYLFDYIARKERDRWWRYKGEFKYEGQSYQLECECKWDNQVFTYRNLFIDHKQVVIDITDPEMIAKYGLG